MSTSDRQKMPIWMASVHTTAFSPPRPVYMMQMIMTTGAVHIRFSSVTCSTAKHGTYMYIGMVMISSKTKMKEETVRTPRWRKRTCKYSYEDLTPRPTNTGR